MSSGAKEPSGYREEPQWKLDWTKLPGPRIFEGDDWVAEFEPKRARVVVRLRLRYFMINTGLGVLRADLSEKDNQVRLHGRYVPAPFWAFVYLGLIAVPMILRATGLALGAVLVVLLIALVVVVVPMVAARGRLTVALNHVASELERRLQQLVSGNA